MRLLNTGEDVTVYGIGFPKGVAVDVPDTLREDKRAHLASMFAEVATVSPSMDEPLPPPEVAFDSPPAFLRGRRRRSE